MRTLFFIAILALSNNAFAQGKKNVDRHNSSHIAPKLLDIKRFEKDVVCKGELKAAYNALKKDSWMFTYIYYFTVTKTGKVRPRELGAAVNDTLFSKLNGYINNIFNRYHWRPGYLKKCRMCKIDQFMQLRLFFRPNVKKIDIHLVMAEYYSEVFLYKHSISEYQLSALNTGNNCFCCQ